MQILSPVLELEEGLEEVLLPLLCLSLYKSKLTRVVMLSLGQSPFYRMHLRCPVSRVRGILSKFKVKLYSSSGKTGLRTFELSL